MHNTHILLTADSGSTKTTWRLATDEKPTESAYINTQGINPIHQNDEEILSILRKELLPQMADTGRTHGWSSTRVSRISFYGAGCFGEFSDKVSHLLGEVFPQATAITVDSDLMGAAIALYGHEPGIACILGTGANSGLYDGERIVAHTNPMGYILGDEGSGASLGKSFLNLLYKGHLPHSLRQEFERSTGMGYAEVVQRVYREPLAARFLASLSPFIHSHLDVPEVSQMVTDRFRDFFRLHIAPYRSATGATTAATTPTAVGFVGSVAYHYRDLLGQAAESEGFTLGKVLRQPL